MPDISLVQVVEMVAPVGATTAQAPAPITSGYLCRSMPSVDVRCPIPSECRAFKTTAIRHPSASKSPEFARFPVPRHAEWPGVTGRVTVAEHAAVVVYLIAGLVGGLPFPSISITFTLERRCSSVGEEIIRRC